MANNQKETIRWPIHTYKEREKYEDRKVDENYLSEEELLYTTEKKFRHKEFQDAIFLDKAQRRVIRNTSNNEGNKMWTRRV